MEEQKRTTILITRSMVKEKYRRVNFSQLSFLKYIPVPTLEVWFANYPLKYFVCFKSSFLLSIWRLSFTHTISFCFPSFLPNIFSTCPFSRTIFFTVYILHLSLAWNPFHSCFRTHSPNGKSCAQDYTYGMMILHVCLAPGLFAKQNTNQSQ